MSGAKRILRKILFSPGIFLRYYMEKVLIRLKYRDDPVRKSKSDWLSLQSFRNSLIHKLRRKHRREIAEYHREIDANYTPAPRGDTHDVWVCWLQGEGNMPPLVRQCYESVKRKFKNIAGGGHSILCIYSPRTTTAIMRPCLISL